MRIVDHLRSLNALEREIVKTDSRAPPKRQKWLSGLRSGSPGVLAEAVQKTGRAEELKPQRATSIEILPMASRLSEQDQEAVLVGSLFATIEQNALN
jgi:hypothetical protein